MLVFYHSFLNSIQQRFVGLFLSVTPQGGTNLILFTKDMHKGGPEGVKMKVTRATLEMPTKDTALTLRERTNGRS